MYEGVTVDEGQTPAEMGMEDDDILDVMMAVRERQTEREREREIEREK